MPIYEYQCSDCGHEAEVFQRMSDPDETQCPACQSEQWQRLVSAAGFRLKGGGWYETDFKSGNKRNLTGQDGKEGKEGKSGKDSSGDSAKGSGTGSGESASSGSTSTASDSKPAGGGKDGGGSPKAAA